MKNKIIVVGMMLVLVAIYLGGCIQQQDPLKGLGYVNKQYGFGLNPPEGWTTDENDQFGAVVRFDSPIENSSAVNLGITKSYTLNASETLNIVVEQLLAQYPVVITNFTLVSNSARTVNGMNAHEIIYTFVQGIYALKGRQVIIEKNKKVFFLTYTALPDRYDIYNSVVEQSINSFTII